MRTKISTRIQFAILLRLITLIACVGGANTVLAAEGGGSVYLQGTYGDFAVAKAGPAGIYLRNDLALYDASIGARPLGGAVSTGMDSKVWLNVLKLSWISDIKILGGTLMSAIALPYALHVDVSGRGSRDDLQIFRQGTTNGFGDPFLTPLAINWANGAHNITAAIGVNVPWGKYDIEDQLNLGRNYWAADPAVSYTYLDDLGWDVSLTAGILFNKRNKDTNYKTGNEFHLDWFAGRHLSQTFGLGLVGYWYQQISDDDGSIPSFLSPGFRGRGIGVGPAVLKTFTVGKRDFTLIGKWVHDIENENRLNGDIVMFSLALKL